MISWLKGKVQHYSKDILILDVNGVGYELLISSTVVNSNLSLGQQKELIVHTDVKENSISLFGFNTFAEKEVFLLLKKVKGVGSKLAMSIISKVGATAVLKSIGREDISMLTTVPGVGKKSAERIILELREKVTDFVGPQENLKNKIEISSSEQDAVLALERLGFSKNQAKTAVEKILTEGEVDTSAILRKALAII